MLMVALAAMVAALPAFAKEKGKPSDPNGFGTAASQIATNNNGSKDDGSKGGGLGEHSRDPEGDGKGGPREGIGNVARDEPDTDGSVGAHGCKQLAAMGGNCSDGPGKGNGKGK